VLSVRLGQKWLNGMLIQTIWLNQALPTLREGKRVNHTLHEGERSVKSVASFMDGVINAFALVAGVINTDQNRPGQARPVLACSGLSWPVAASSGPC